MRRIPRLRVATARLSNGLRILACERRHHPVVAGIVWYGVGSRDESTGETGLAHFLEHLTFKGTRRFRKGMIDLLTARFGGTNNASTDTDATAYEFTFASDRWEVGLDIEAERMRRCVLEPLEFEAERNVVLEEMRMGRDDPWRDLYEEVAAAAYVVHPYRNPVIGWEEDLRRVKREAVLAFYRRHYRPENAWVVLVGDLDARRAIAAVRRRFRRIRPPRLAGPLPAAARFAPTEPPGRGERRIEVARPDTVARVLVGFRGCRIGDAEDLPLQAAAVVLSSGKTSRFYRRLVRGRRVATRASADHDPRCDPGMFWISLEPRAGVGPDRAVRALLAEVDRFAKRGPTRGEVEGAKRTLVAAASFQMESAGEIAEAIGRLAVAGRPEQLRRYVPSVLRLTPRQVREAAARVFRGESRVVGIARPTASRAGSRDGEGAGEGGADAAPPGARRIPLHLPSPPRTAPSVRIAARRAVLPNGLVVLATRNRSAPVVTASALVEAGPECEPASLAGLSSLAFDLLDEGTRGRSGAEIADAVESTGGSLDTSPGGVTLSLPADEIGFGLDLMADLLGHPTFPADAVRRHRALACDRIRADEDDPTAVAFQRLRERVYGRHPYRRPVRGWVHTVRRIRRGHLLSFHRRTFAPERTILAVSGDVDPREVIGRARRAFGPWRAASAPTPPPPSPPRPARGGTILERRPRAQVQAVLGHVGIRRTDPDYETLLVLDHVLGCGSGFTDRLSRRLRDDLGLAYGVHASITGTAGVEPGVFAASIGTAPETFRWAIAEVRREIDRIVRTAPSVAELQVAKDFLVGSYVFGLERNAGRAGYLLHRERLRLGEDFLDAYPRRIAAVTRADVLRAARRHVFPSALTLVAVGPVGRG